MSLRAKWEQFKQDWEASSKAADESIARSRRNWERKQAEREAQRPACRVSGCGNKALPNMTGCQRHADGWV